MVTKLFYQICMPCISEFVLSLFVVLNRNTVSVVMKITIILNTYIWVGYNSKLINKMFTDVHVFC